MFGVIAAVPTPVNTAGIPQQGLFISHCQWALENGCNGLNLLGSTGEANSFDTETRKLVMTWAANSLDRTKLMVGTGTPSLSETLDLTCCADDLGYGVALVLPPYYYKPVSEEGLFAWYADLHQKLGRRKIALYFYNFPQMTGLVIPISVIERLHDAWPDRFCGIKDSSGDLDYCRQLASRLPNLAVFPSSETSLGEAKQYGFAGCISATVNQTSRLCAKVWSGEEVDQDGLLTEIGNIRNAISSTALIPAIKYLVGQRSGESSWEKLLPPFQTLSDQHKRELAPVVRKLASN
ncbi:dihydrodipicolinate synthase family protein [Sneathiella marina]|uniref:Dihydrodipicolinate synthase family protein n=1 Tax=Sneathiella marina TaxID=2950108 RepID=A0ABY4W495_9PROT|nr:dihydrodipicolinate synthase family protein [Sneathiella marina]USG62016.1 dihydrodipicolinate synthase family protein [Sneathiella marina]